jgi:site-specific recombinase
MHLPPVGLPPQGPAPLPDAAAFGSGVYPQTPTQRAVQRLHALFVALDPDAELVRQSQAFEELAHFLRNGPKAPALPDSEPTDRPQVGRLRLLARACEVFPACGARLARVLASVFAEAPLLGLLSRAGIPADRGLFGETMDRLSRSILPQPIDPQDFGQLISNCFPARRDVVWLASVPAALSLRLAVALGPAHTRGPSPWPELERGAADALSLIAQRVSAVGLYDVLRERSPRVPLRSSPFFLLPRATDALLGAYFSGDRLGQANALGDCQALVKACYDTVAAVTHNLEHTGVSVDAVYRLELITKNLERYEAVLERLTTSDPPERADGVKRLLIRLLDARRKERDLGEIITNNLHLLARKIIERAGHTGEHYITTSRREYVKMLLSAGGGGVLTTGTAATKYFVAWGHFAPFVEGMLSAVNYAGSFLVMQALGFTLATKQPSMTAAALAHSMKTSASERDLSALVTMIARITRSQLAAAIGNIGMVIPTALAFDLFWRSRSGHSFLDETTATYVVHSLHPTQSGTIGFAALTGVLLWVSSVGAGWLENWATYRRLPEAIAEHRIGRLIGRRTTAWASRVFAHSISGIGGNVVLGFLLGMTPVAGKFFGLPLDVRHVTLSTGSLTLAIASQGLAALSSPEVRAAALGIAIIGALNFGVSFVLAISIALRAREVPYRDRLRLLASVVVTAVRSPLQFVFPPRTPDAVPVHGPVSAPPPAVH